MDVKDAARAITKDIVFMDTHGAGFSVTGVMLEPSSNKHVALYRLPPVKKPTIRKPATGDSQPVMKSEVD